MNVVGKVFLGLGAASLVLGLVMAGAGKNTLDDGVETFEEWEGFVLENGTNGTLSVTDDDGDGDFGFTFWIEGEYVDEDNDGRWDHCEATNITILSHPDISDNPFFEYAEELDGEFYYEVGGKQGCEAGEDSYPDETHSGEGLVKVGRACWGCYAGTMEFESNTTVWVSYDDLLLGQVLEGGLGILSGGLGILGGAGLLGCGFCSLLLGGILAIALNDPKEATQMQQPPSVRPRH